ncbi:MAG: hypothetical protein C4541_04860 [Candidatus Auribacter fodinae]|uniref:Recombinase family protein n=1 Tax=Candidatus Auribacter fodinae TaxID=2093366 RepID=A0A3A4R1W0_9BACT|nr:MAG: hypothetical protein C4541_04860 [Candidatus Auribacter fodinae]
MNGQFNNSFSEKAGLKELKAIIYCRVSTTEQAVLGFSLAAQEKVCRDYAERNSFQVVKVFIEHGESAKSIKRTQLNNLLEYASKNFHNIDVLIVYKLDRLARNMVDYTNLIQNFGQMGIDVKSATENLDETSTGKLMKNIIASFAQFENDVKSERTINGMRQAIKEGRWCWCAPLGYRFSREQSKRPILVPNNDSELVKEAFKLAEKGLYKQTEIIELLRSKGFKKINKQRMNCILRNALYAGMIKVDWYPEMIDAVHEPLISKETFYTVQMILDGKKPTIQGKIKNNPDFPLRNFVVCEKCGSPLTGAWSRGRAGKRYAYYRCQTKGCHLNVKKQTMENDFFEYLKSFQPKPEILDLFEEIITDVWETRQKDKAEDQIRLEQELDLIKEKKAKLLDLMLDETISAEEYKEKTREIENRTIVKKVELHETSTDLYDIEAYVKFCRFFIENLSNLWASANLELKQRFQNLVFPEGIKYDGRLYRTSQVSAIFEFVKNFPQKYDLAPPVGLEPTT